MAAKSPVTGPDFGTGVPRSEVQDGATVAGRTGDQPVLVSRRGQDYFAVSGSCTHYGGLLADGRIGGDHAHCPLHHACFNVLTGEAIEAPAFASLTRWRVAIDNDILFVREQLQDFQKPAGRAKSKHPDRIVIVGGGAAGFAAAEMLRRRGFSGELTMLSSDVAPPCDRPNLSKDYLAGTAPDDWIPLRDADFYRQHDIDLRLGATVSAIDARRREVAVADERLPYDALLLATGSTPIRLKGPDFDRPNVHVLRSLSDARAIIAASENGKSAAVIGASFIGLESAGALRTRGLEVHVIAPEQVPLLKVLGAEIGNFVRSVHEQHGVQFHLGVGANTYDGRRLHLSDKTTVDADFVVLGVGVRPNIELAVAAGLAVNGGVIVDRQMRSSDPSIFAAGDIAKYPDQRTQQSTRIEHWVVAERQGQIAAAAMLGEDTSLLGPPFFWSAHYDHSIRYVGHAPEWDDVQIDGAVGAGGFMARYLLNGRLLAAASLGRDQELLEVAAYLEEKTPDHSPP